MPQTAKAETSEQPNAARRYDLKRIQGFGSSKSFVFEDFTGRTTMKNTNSIAKH
jgi:hypothetical protein